MGYAQELRRLLLPLGVYSFKDGSFSMAQLEALGTELDAVLCEIARNQRESIACTAEDEGLVRFEALFPCAGTAQSAAERQAAIAGFLQISDDGFTRDALQRCLAACGADCLLSETGEPDCVCISFPGVMGIPEGIESIRRIAEEILPAHVGIDYFFRWCTWGETEGYGFSWGDLGNMTWHDWMVYTEEE